MRCFFCKREVEDTADDLAAVLCARCVARCVGPPEFKTQAPKVSYDEKKARKLEREEKKKAKLETMKTAKRGKGRGWHLKKLFQYEDKFFSYGEEVTALVAAKLKKEVAAEDAAKAFAPAKKRGRKPNAVKLIKRKKVTR